MVYQPLECSTNTHADTITYTHAHARMQAFHTQRTSAMLQATYVH